MSLHRSFDSTNERYFCFTGTIDVIASRSVLFLKKQDSHPMPWRTVDHTVLL